MKWLMPEIFGLIALIISTIDMMGLAEALRFDQLFYNRPEENRGEENFNYLVMRSLTVPIIMVFLIPFYFISHPEKEAGTIFWVFMAFFLFNKLLLGMASLYSLEATKKWKRYRFEGINTAIGIFCSLIALAMAKYGFSYWSLVVKYLLSSILMILYFSWKFPFELKFHFNISICRWYLAKGKQLFLNNMVSLFSGRIDDILIGYGISQSILGVYSKAFHFVRLPIELFSNSMIANNYPLLITHKHNSVKINQLIRIIVDLNVIVIGLIMVNLLLVMYYMIHVFFGTTWEKVYPLSLGLMFLSFGKPFLDVVYNYMLIIENFKIMNRIFIWYGLAEIILIFLGYRFYGYWGVTIAQSLAMMCAMFIIHYYAHFGFSLIKNIFLVFGFILCGFLLLNYFQIQPTTIRLLVLEMVVGTSIYSFIIYLIMRDGLKIILNIVRTGQWQPIE